MSYMFPISNQHIVIHDNFIIQYSFLTVRSSHYTEMEEFRSLFLSTERKVWIVDFFFQIRRSVKWWCSYFTPNTNMFLLDFLIRCTPGSLVFVLNILVIENLSRCPRCLISKWICVCISISLQPSNSTWNFLITFLTTTNHYNP